MRELRVGRRRPLRPHRPPQYTGAPMRRLTLLSCGLLPLGPPARLSSRRLRAGGRLHRAAVPRPQRARRENHDRVHRVCRRGGRAGVAGGAGLRAAVRAGHRAGRGRGRARRLRPGRAGAAAAGRARAAQPARAAGRAGRGLPQADPARPAHPDRQQPRGPPHAGGRRAGGVLRPDGSLGGDLVRVLDYDDAGQQRLAGRQPVHRGRERPQPPRRTWCSSSTACRWR